MCQVEVTSIVMSWKCKECDQSTYIQLIREPRPVLQLIKEIFFFKYYFNILLNKNILKNNYNCTHNL